ncbi:P-loop containing nucleoside triphosphate hydrolase protein [Trametes elegans]|nr:P-loop containing nucleoside triphosphate hydrolase protein [Trametes elegans]
MSRHFHSLLFNLGGCSELFAPDIFDYFENSPSKSDEPASRQTEPSDRREDVHSMWLASRRDHRNVQTLLPPGAQRPLTVQNAKLAFAVSKHCALDIPRRLWHIHPYRISFMVGSDLVRGAFPALRGFSHALIIDEVQKSILSGNFAVFHIARYALMEILRMAVETAIDSIATYNENAVQSSARFLVEHAQLEYRLRPDVPTLSDPLVCDLLQEADIFVRSFNGFSSFGLFSPLDFMRIVTLVSELFAHLWVLFSLTFGATPFPVMLLSITLSALPSLLSWGGGPPKPWDSRTSRLEARLAAKQAAMRHLAHSEAYRPEVMLFDLGPWVLRTWARARQALLGLEGRHDSCESDLFSRLLPQLYISGAFSAFEHIPVLLVLNSSASSLGAFTLYRSTLQSLFLTAGALINTLRMAFQGVFLMGAFSAATELRPRLEPPDDQAIPYRPSAEGMAIDIRNISFTYPGHSSPVLRDVSLSVRAGESVAIVGCNGSGKTTLAKVLLRIVDFDLDPGRGRGAGMRVNGADVRRLRPHELHARASAVLQGFAKFGGASVRANVGVGFVPDMRDAGAVHAALSLARADALVRALPDGLKTPLDGGEGSFRAAGDSDGAFGGGLPSRRPHGLSGGEWQRIAISRSFMRARRPEVELLVFDEPTSSLDAHAQKQFFDTVEQISRGPDGHRTKTVVFITHRLSTARRADKIAMMENGTITEVGTHQQLLARDGRYAALYRASV